MKKAVVYGAGNIGRGFIGVLLAQSGYTVTFVDIAEETVNLLHAEKGYPLRIVDGNAYEDFEISGVDAVNGNDVDAVAKAISEADIMAVSVGARALPHVIPNILAGLRLRWKSTSQPFDIIICENLMEANSVIGKLFMKLLEPGERAVFDERVGLVETSVGRMVPIQTPEMRDGNPLRICTEKYGFLPADKSAFKGEIPKIKGMLPFESFDFYVKRKLYLHNMAHAVCAYIGMLAGVKHISEAAEHPTVRLIVREAMWESISVLSEEYGASARELSLNADDLMARFANHALKDTCERVGSDPARKLGANDRLIGAARLCEKHGVFPAYIAAGAAGALYSYFCERGETASIKEVSKTLDEICGIKTDERLGKLILKLYETYINRDSAEELLRAAAECKKWAIGEIV